MKDALKEQLRKAVFVTSTLTSSALGGGALQQAYTAYDESSQATDNRVSAQNIREHCGRVRCEQALLTKAAQRDGKAIINDLLARDAISNVPPLGGGSLGVATLAVLTRRRKKVEPGSGYDPSSF